LNQRLFVSQASNYILYIPIAVGIGLMSRKINDLFARTAFRLVSLAIVLIAMIVHVGSGGILLTREIYGVAVFLAALQPWSRIPFNIWQTLASYSYGIYILHFLPAQILWMFVVYKNLEFNGAEVLGITVITYFGSFAMAVLLRKLFPAEWFLPLVAVSSGNNRQTII
jgi:peptidoglycan/LPS O-acetylase OafA/YrhL